MNNEQHAAFDFERILKQFPGFMKGLTLALEEINAIGSIKQATKEAQQRLAQAKKEYEKFGKEVEAKHQELEAFARKKQEEAESYAQGKQLEANKVLKDAGFQAQQKVEAAKSAAQDIKAEADKKASAVTLDVQVARKTLTTLTEAVKNKQVELDELEAAIEAASASHTDLKVKLDEIKAKFG